MQKQTIIALCAVCAGCAALLLLTHSKEPSSNGHHLSYWVRTLGSMSSTEHERQMATEAVDHIGAAAAPFLVRWIQYEPTKWTERQKKLANLLCRVRYSLALRMGRSIYYTKRERLANGATQAFLHTLDEACEKTDGQVHAYCLLYWHGKQQKSNR